MNIVLSYPITKQFSFHTIDLCLLEDTEKRISMECNPSQGRWEATLFLPPGRYFYRFLLDDRVYLIDPASDFCGLDEKDDFWSILLVDSDGERIVPTGRDQVQMLSYALLPFLTAEPVVHDKKQHCPLTDEQVVLRLTFGKITGFHLVSVLWRDSYGEFSSFDEQLIYDCSEDCVMLWFSFRIEPKLSPGNWQVWVFLDGGFVFGDCFLISSSTLTYNNQGRLL